MEEMNFYSPKAEEKGLSHLHYYCWWFHPPGIKWALNNGGDVNEVDDVYKQTPLLMLGKIYSGSLKRKKHSFRLLVAAGSDVFSVGGNGNNLLQEVKRMGSKGFQRFLKAEFKRRKKLNLNT